MIRKQEVGDRAPPVPDRSLAWLAGVAIAAAALMVVVVGSLSAAKPVASAAARDVQPAISAVLVSPIDHSVVESIDASAEPDTSGASIAAYGP